MIRAVSVGPSRDTGTPRIAVRSRANDGSVLIEDRATGQHLLIYLAATAAQTDGGHARDRWHIREAGSTPVNAPASRPFEGRAAAMDAIRDGSWGLLPSRADVRPVRRRQSN